MVISLVHKMHGTSVEHSRTLLRHVLNTVLAEREEDGRKAAHLQALQL